MPNAGEAEVVMEAVEAVGAEVEVEVVTGAAVAVTGAAAPEEDMAAGEAHRKRATKGAAIMAVLVQVGMGAEIVVHKFMAATVDPRITAAAIAATIGQVTRI